MLEKAKRRMINKINQTYTIQQKLKEKSRKRSNE